MLTSSYSVYKITNKVNGKIYIGRTTGTIAKRLKEHQHAAFSKDKARNGCRLLCRAIRKYGKENFNIELLESLASFKEMKNREGELIRSNNSYDDKIGYNLTYSTEDGDEFISEETRKRVTISTREAKFLGKTKEIGVWRGQGEGSWKSAISYRDESFIKTFKSKDEAVEFYDKLSLYFHGPDCLINKDGKREEYLKSDLNKMIINLRIEKENKKLRNKGVSFYKGRGSYAASYGQLRLGSFKTKQEAIEFRDRIALFLGKDEDVVFKNKIEEYKRKESEVVNFMKLKTDLNRINPKNKIGYHNTVSLTQNNRIYWGYDFRIKGERSRKTGFKNRENAALARDILYLKTLINSKMKLDKIKLNFPIASIFILESGNSEETVKSLMEFKS